MVPRRSLRPLATAALTFKETSMSIQLPFLKPRNPLVALARARRAGSHEPGRKTLRQQDQHALRRELSRAEADRRSP